MAFLLADMYTSHLLDIFSCLNIGEIHVPLFVAQVYEFQPILVASSILSVQPVCTQQFCHRSSGLFPEEVFQSH